MENRSGLKAGVIFFNSKVFYICARPKKSIGISTKQNRELYARNRTTENNSRAKRFGIGFRLWAPRVTLAQEMKQNGTTIQNRKNPERNLIRMRKSISPSRDPTARFRQLDKRFGPDSADAILQSTSLQLTRSKSALESF